MRQPSRKTITNKLDKLVSELVRKRGRCERCGKEQNLQCAHIFSRSNRAVRWHRPNLLCLCPDCHINFAHKNPILFTEWVRNFLGEIAYLDLKTEARKSRQWATYELIDMYNKLKSL